MNRAPTPEASAPTCGLPKVSIVVPCHNGRRWIGETLASTRRPYPWPVELIVVDDGSTDGSGELVARDSPEMRLVRRRIAAAARCGGTARGPLLLQVENVARGIVCCKEETKLRRPRGSRAQVSVSFPPLLEWRLMCGVDADRIRQLVQ